MSELQTDLRFAMVPLWVLDLKLSDKAFRLYAVLARHADYTTHETIIGRKRLAAEMRCTVNTVDRAKAELVERKCISVQQRQRPSGESERNGYIVHRIPPEGAPARGEGWPHGRGQGAPTRDAPVNENQENEKDRAPTAHSLVREAWEAAPGAVRHKDGYYSDAKVRSAIDRAVKKHGVEDVVAAVGLYAEVVRSPDTTWSHRWPLREFLERGVDRFVPEADPKSVYRSRRNGVSQDDSDANAVYDRNVQVIR